MTTSVAALPDQEAPAAPGRRYTPVAMALHWAVAVLVLTQLGIGWYMNTFLHGHTAPQDRMQEVHIQIGFTAFILILIRLAWRLFNPPPPPAAGIPAWERWLSGTVQALLYAMMLIMPLSGWFFRTVREHSLPFWGLTWPHFPGTEAILGDRKYAAPVAHLHQELFFWIFGTLIVLHVLGAIKHQFDGRSVLWRMIPFLKPLPARD